MNSIIATINLKRIDVYDDVFIDDKQKQQYINASDEEKRQFIADFYYDNCQFDNDITIDLYE